MQVYQSPYVEDLDNDDVTIEVAGNIYNFITVVTTKEYFKLNIDHS